MDKYWKRENGWDVHIKTGRREHPLAKKDKYMYRLNKECREMSKWELETLLRLKNKRYKELETTEERRYFRCSMKIIRDWKDVKFQEEADEWGVNEIPLEPGSDMVILENNKSYTYDFNEDESEIIVRDVEGCIVNRYYDKKDEDEENE